MVDEKDSLNKLFDDKFKSMEKTIEGLRAQIFENIERLKQDNAALAQHLNALTLEIRKDVEAKIKYVPISENARDPVRANRYDAGIDLKSAYDLVVPARGRKLIHTDLQFELPPGYFGKIESRSGLSLKNGIETGAGVIDESYRGPLGIILHNHTDQVFYIKAGERIAQMVLHKYGTHELVKLQSGELTSTERGDNGFGSSGYA